nr:MAG TPA: hypothetical protein [Caudoviricetes sp.]
MGAPTTKVVCYTHYTCKHVHTPVWCGVNFSPRPHTGVVIHAPRERR